MIDGYPVTSIKTLMKTKLNRAIDRDVTDLIWLCKNRQSDVQAVADSLDYSAVLGFAGQVKDHYTQDFGPVCRALDIDEEEVR